MNTNIGFMIIILLFLIKTSHVFGKLCYECESTAKDESCKTVFYQQKKYLTECSSKAITCYTVEVFSRDALGDYAVRRGCYIRGENIYGNRSEIQPVGHYHYCPFDACNYDHNLFDFGNTAWRFNQKYVMHFAALCFVLLH
ncbi:uncharacterized protein LOC119608047 [Lucilia sericata]|uniref:uncharacterized protein LOC119608047 n=1 Tax=Lucilia sericata TaxID=13632 RepID=UPI0018A880A8|nr:uncharacterized protein LOC119608047 [Lucilia sericata]